ncbi:MAG: polysaccharide deacetylase family protein [Syntrophobacteraceae bacterium]
MAALVCSVAIAMLKVELAAVPAALFVLSCLTAPFLFKFSFYLPIISRGRTRKKFVALTFDDGPDPASTPHLLRLLAAYQVQATFFVIGLRARAHPELIQSILAAGHSIGNHSFSHDPFVAFKGQKKIAEQILMSQQVLEDLGVSPMVFRPPSGITYPGLARVLEKLGLVVVTFSCRAGDCCNRRIENLAERIIKRARPDDIIMLHDYLPQGWSKLSQWLGEVERILLGIREKRLEFCPLSELIGRPVDRRRPQFPLQIGAFDPVGNSASKGDPRPDNHR